TLMSAASKKPLRMPTWIGHRLVEPDDTPPAMTVSAATAAGAGRSETAMANAVSQGPWACRPHFETAGESPAVPGRFIAHKRRPPHLREATFVVAPVPKQSRCRGDPCGRPRRATFTNPAGAGGAQAGDHEGCPYRGNATFANSSHD